MLRSHICHYIMFYSLLASFLPLSLTVYCHHHHHHHHHGVCATMCVYMNIVCAGTTVPWNKFEFREVSGDSLFIQLFHISIPFWRPISSHQTHI